MAALDDLLRVARGRSFARFLNALFCSCAQTQLAPDDPRRHSATSERREGERKSDRVQTASRQCRRSRRKIFTPLNSPTHLGAHIANNTTKSKEVGYFSLNTFCVYASLQCLCVQEIILAIELSWLISVLYLCRGYYITVLHNNQFCILRPV